MKAVVIEKPGVMSFQEVEKPVPEKGFALVKIKAAAVCATDLEVIDGKIPANYPLIPGHEWSGIVEEVGDEKDKGWIGKKVIGSNDVVCLTCDACRSGEWRYCSDFEEIGFKRNGAYAEYAVFPVYGLCEKAENVSFEEAALCEPLGVALGTFKKAHAKYGSTLLIMGAGSIGLCMLAVGKAMGMKKIVVCAKSEKRLNIAKEMGAHATVATENSDIEEEIRRLHPEGTDIVIDATGIEECIQSCLRIAKRGGKVLLAGYGRGKEMKIRMDDIHIKNLKVIGAGNNWNMHKKAMQMMADGSVDLKSFVSETLPLEEFERAVKMVRQRPEGFIKAVFTHE